MKRMPLLVCILLIFTASVASAQILSPHSRMYATFDITTNAFFVGKTHINGSFYGCSLPSIAENPFTDDIAAFPFFGEITIENVEKISIVPIESITNITWIKLAILAQNAQTIQQATIYAHNGTFILGAETGSMSVQTTLDFAITSLLEFTIQETNIPFLAILTSQQILRTFSGTDSFFSPLTSGDITITDNQNNTVYSSNTTQIILYIQDDSFTCTQKQPFHLLPIRESSNTEPVSLRYYPAEDVNTHFQIIKQNLSIMSAVIDNSSDITQTLSELEPVLPVVSRIMNCGIFVLGTNDTAVIDNSQQQFSTLGFARANNIDTTINAQIQPLAMKTEGTYRLILLGDHLYVPQAKESDNGLGVPIAIILIWVIALIVFFYVHTSLEKKGKKEIHTWNRALRRVSLIFYILSIILTFILVDWEISYQFGLSAITSIITPEIPGILFVIFIIFEIILWVLGYFLLALPVRIITNTGLRAFGIGKHGRGIGKGIGIFTIWVFCAVYAQMIMNIFLLIIQPQNLLSM